jgi:hypothetical protein
LVRKRDRTEIADRGIETPARGYGNSVAEVLGCHSSAILAVAFAERITFGGYYRTADILKGLSPGA